jgi:gliding motility-associated-like protein
MKAVLQFFSLTFSHIIFAQLCPGPTGPNLFPEGDFGSGSANILQIDPGIAPGYMYTTNPPPIDGDYCITNDISIWNFGWSWHLIQDNSTDPNGYMMVVNASYDSGLFYEYYVDGLCENATYVFSCDIFNLADGSDHIKPNVSFLIDGVDSYNTGDVPNSGAWETYGFLFTTGPGQTAVNLSLMNNADGGYGNDLAIDNITFSQCGPEAILPQQEDMGYFESYCQGLEVQFDNLSYGTSVYQWDFGVDGTDDDVATGFLPSYTYPAPGTYTVMLIANPGAACTDTAYSEITIYEDISAFFLAPDAQCVSTNSFDFHGEGVFPSSGATFQWDFGADATQSSSTIQNPTGIVFSSSGIKEITYTVSYESCETSYSEEVLVASPSTINFAVPDELRCVAYELQFSNLSQSSTEMFSLWDFGDGGSSSDLHPFHNYLHPGNYDVSLTIWTTSGCIDTLVMTRPSLIEVHPRPTAAFSIEPQERLEFNPEFEFTNLSLDGISSQIYFTDGNSTTDDYKIHTYNNQVGVLIPWQIVYNEFGCSDKAFNQLKIIPVLDVMVPNSFTPNGDALNNTFQPVLYNEQVYELQVFNRWGELIHQSKEWNAFWDGASNGVIAEDGVYIWRLIYTDIRTGNLSEIEGHVQLIR